MKRTACKRRLAVAESRLAHANADLHAATARLRARFDRHGPLALIGTGVATGAAAGALPLGALVRIARTLTSAAMLLLRVPTALWVGAVGMHDPARSTDPTR